MKHNFQDFFNPICACRYEVETTTHYIRYCPIYSNKRMTLLDKIRNINIILEQNNTIITKSLLIANISHGDTLNTFILNGTTEYLISNKSFDASIFSQ